MTVKRTPLLVVATSIKGIPSPEIKVDPVQMIADFSEGTDPQELVGGFNIAVEDDLVRQVKKYQKIGVNFDSGLLMGAWAHSKSTKNKEMFNLLVSLGATATDFDKKSMGDDFKRDYEEALKLAEHSPESPTSRRKLDT